MNKILLAALLLLLSAVTGRTTTFAGQLTLGNAPRGVVVSGKVRTKQGTFQSGFVHTVTLNPESSWNGVTRPPVNSLGNLSESLEVPVRKDGTFEFRSIRPGKYALRTLPITSGASVVSVEVAYQNLRDIEIVVPFQVEISGHIINLPLNLQVHPVIQADRGNFTMATTALDDGTFKLRLTEGENRVLVSKLPPGLVVKAITFGQTDITSSSLNVDATTAPQSITITIETAILPVVSANK